MKKLLIAISAIIILVGCKPIKEISYVDRWHETTKYDSVYNYIHDSTFVKIKNDTVFISNWSTKIDYKYKYLNEVDTIIKIKTEFKTVTVVKEKKVTNWFSIVDFIILGLFFLFGVYKLLRFLKVIP